MINIVYMGTPEYAKKILLSLIKDKNIYISLVITQPNRPFGRKKIIKESEVKKLAKENNLITLQPEKLSDEGVYEAIYNSNPDLIIVAAFGQILPKNILNISPCINLHASILPEYRGASPIHQSILNKDKFTGITAILMEEGLDTGPILGFSYFNIPIDITISDIQKELTILASKLTLDIIKNFSNLNPIKQTLAKGNYCKKIKKEDGLIKFYNSLEIYNKYRTFKIWPNIFLESGLKLKDINFIENKTKNIEAKILKIEKESIFVGCQSGILKINIVQPISKKEMTAKAYCLGKRLQVEDYFY